MKGEKFVIGIVILMLLTYGMSSSINASIEGGEADNSEPIETPRYEEGDSTYIKVGHVEAVYGNYGDGDVTVEAYQKSVVLNDEDGDGTIRASVGVDYGIWKPDNLKKRVFILFGIWGGGNNRAAGSKIVVADSSGWTYGDVIDTFVCPITLISPQGTTFTTHVRAICVFGYDHSTAPFKVTLGNDGYYREIMGLPKTVDVRIDYSSGTVIAENVVSITPGSSVGQYYLNTEGGESYLIDDTVPTYLIE